MEFDKNGVIHLHEVWPVSLAGCIGHALPLGWQIDSSPVDAPADKQYCRFYKAYSEGDIIEYRLSVHDNGDGYMLSRDDYSVVSDRHYYQAINWFDNARAAVRELRECLEMSTVYMLKFGTPKPNLHPVWPEETLKCVDIATAQGWQIYASSIEAPEEEQYFRVAGTSQRGNIFVCQIRVEPDGDSILSWAGISKNGDRYNNDMGRRFAGLEGAVANLYQHLLWEAADEG